MSPDFIDNQNGNTLAQAICGQLRELRESGKIPHELSVATAYFNPEGFRLIAKEVEDVPYIRLLLGANPVAEPLLTRRSPFDLPEASFLRGKVKSELERMEKWLRVERNFLPFGADEDRRIRMLLDFLKSGRIEVRRYEKHFLHAKVYIFRGKEKIVLTGSSNFTRAGLAHNLELNLGRFDEPLLERLEHWYDELWEQAVPFNLAELYEELLADYSPYDIFIKVLWHLYHAELQQEAESSEQIQLTTFQKHGVWRALHILNKYGGVLVADSVGLGKTFTAGEIIRLYRERRQRVLLICPAALRDTTWKRFLYKHQLLVECVSYEQLAGESQLGGERTVLQSALEDYALVVVDEAHNYRNPDSTQLAKVLRNLLAGRRRDMLMLSATPVNNSLWDLYHLLRYFMKQDAQLSEVGVPSIRGRFQEAMKTDPYNLSPDMLYPIIDATTVKRTRKFVRKHYQGDSIHGPDGTLMQIVFPKPIAVSITYDLEQVLPGFLSRLERILMPEEPEKPLLTMARYQPEHYLLDDSDREDSAIVGLLRSGLLKRFESSAHAFCSTLKKMVEHHEAFLIGMENGKVMRPEFYREVAATDTDWKVEDYLNIPEYTEPIENYKHNELREAVSNDLGLLKEMHSEVQQVTKENDPKLHALVETLKKIAEQADRESFDQEDARQKYKVLVFSFYSDTISWIEEFLEQEIARNSGLKVFQNRMVSVSGQGVSHGVSREQAVWGFAPVSSEAPDGIEDRFDLLLCTDVLAEGMNLQQSRHIINYDLPWNPMRLVQRHGRIDRIGSPHKKVYLHTFFPDKQLDHMLRLEERVRRKLAQAAASIGLETSPIQDGSSRDQSFAETRIEIENLRKENAELFEQGGTEGAAQTGEEYRQELRKALQTQGERLENLPWRIGSGMCKGLRSGFFFLAAIGDRNFLRFVTEDEIIREWGTCLRLIECNENTPSHMTPEMHHAAYQKWETAQKDVYEEWMGATDQKNLLPYLRPLSREIANYLRKHPHSEVEQKKLERCIDAVESPIPLREERELRETFKLELGNTSTKTLALVDKIEQLGLEPYQVSKPLPIIEQEEVRLVCWLGVEAE